VLESHSKLEIASGIAIVTPNWMACAGCCCLCLGGVNQLLPVPRSAIVISLAASGTVTARHELGQMLVTTATCPLHGSDVVTVKHVLHRIYTEKAIVIGGVVTVEIVVGVVEI